MRWAEAEASIAKVRPLGSDGAAIRADLVASGAIRTPRPPLPLSPCAHPIDDRAVLEAARTILATQPFERLEGIAEQADPRVAARLRAVLQQYAPLLLQARAA